MDAQAILDDRIAIEWAKRRRENSLAHYRPYPKQIDFHDAGATHRERLFMAGNQLGKTVDLSLTKGVTWLVSCCFSPSFRCRSRDVLTACRRWAFARGTDGARSRCPARSAPAFGR